MQQYVHRVNQKKLLMNLEEVKEIRDLEDLHKLVEMACFKELSINVHVGIGRIELEFW